MWKGKGVMLRKGKEDSLWKGKEVRLCGKGRKTASWKGKDDQAVEWEGLQQ